MIDFSNASSDSSFLSSTDPFLDIVIVGSKPTGAEANLSAVTEYSTDKSETIG